jgi:hypothetical protein
MVVLLTPLILFGISCVDSEAVKHDAQRIQTAMDKNKTAIRKCYDEAAAKSKEFKGGKIHIRADQNPDGTLASFRELETFDDSAEVTRCIEQKLRTWNLGNLETRGPIDLTWDFRYTPKATKKN